MHAYNLTKLFFFLCSSDFEYTCRKSPKKRKKKNNDNNDRQKKEKKKNKSVTHRDIHSVYLSHHNQLTNDETTSLIESGNLSLPSSLSFSSVLTNNTARTPTIIKHHQRHLFPPLLLLPPTEKVLRLLLQALVFLVALGVVPVHVPAAAAARVEVLVLGRPGGGFGHDVRVAGGLGAALAGLDVRGFHVAGAAAL